MDAKRVR